MTARKQSKFSEVEREKEYSHAVSISGIHRVFLFLFSTKLKIIRTLEFVNISISYLGKHPNI